MEIGTVSLKQVRVIKDYDIGLVALQEVKI